jgi:hypothetical protein
MGYGASTRAVRRGSRKTVVAVVVAAAVIAAVISAGIIHFFHACTAAFTTKIRQIRTRKRRRKGGR